MLDNSFTNRQKAILKNIQSYSDELEKISEKIKNTVVFFQINQLCQLRKHIRHKLTGAKKALHAKILPKVNKIPVYPNNTDIKYPHFINAGWLYCVGTNAKINDAVWRLANKKSHCAHVLGFHGATAITKLVGVNDKVTPPNLKWLATLAGAYSEHPKSECYMAKVSIATYDRVLKKKTFKPGQFVYADNNGLLLSEKELNSS